MSKYPKVTDELCMRCIYGYPCEMWDEREVPEKGEECPNFIAKCETEQERDQRIMNGGATIADALSWFKWQAQNVATPMTVSTMLARKIIETLEEDIKREEFVRKEMECINGYRKEATERLSENAVEGAYIRRNRYTKKNVLNGFDVTCDALQKFKDGDRVKIIIVKKD